MIFIKKFFKEYEVVIFIFFAIIISIFFYYDLLKDRVIITLLISMFIYFFKNFYERFLDRKQKNFELKQTYYHEFLKVYTEHLSCVANNKPNNEINKRFIIETVRLLIYASSEVIEEVERIKNNPTSTKPETILKLIRKDLELNDIKEEYNFKIFKL